MAPAAATDDSLAELEKLVEADVWSVDGSALYDAFESAFTDDSDTTDPTGTSSSRINRHITTGEVS
ncbi:MAG: hypothetical protein IPK83_21605 [Planctomycetes bacterium]|nr:hypothetical protein [Planctomycetota bacterium]